MLLTAILYFRQPPVPVKAQLLQARLELAAGGVWIGETKTTPAQSGAAIVAGSRLRTDSGARALVRLLDGSTIFLRGNTDIKLSAEAVTLRQGEYWLEMPATEKPGLQHHAGETTITSLDAGLSIRHMDNSQTVYVARGRAIVTASKARVELSAGESAVVKNQSAPQVKPVTLWSDWTGGMADYSSAANYGAGSGTIYGVDAHAAPGSPARTLEVLQQSVRAVLRDGISETEVDQTFFNPGEHAVEGWYWFTVPENASVTSFAVETDGQLVEGEFIEKREASKQYSSAKSEGHAPAIFEWVDGHSYRARIFPVPGMGQRRVVVRYLELYPVTAGKLRYSYPMSRGKAVRIGEFSLTVDLGDAGKEMTISTGADARVEAGGKVVSMRRSGFTPRADFQIEATTAEKSPAIRIARFRAGNDSADYLMVRYTPQLDWGSLGKQRADVVVVVDTSAGGDESQRQLQVRTAEAVLRALSPDDRFALVALDVTPKILHPSAGLSPADDKQISAALQQLADHPNGGATDLSALFDTGLQRLHGAEQPALVYIGDGNPTSGALSAEQLTDRLRRSLSTSKARLFTVGVGSEANHSTLGALAHAAGGKHFRLSTAEESTPTALHLASALKQPTLSEIKIDLGAGLDSVFQSSLGKVSRGSELVVLARSHHQLPSEIKVSGRLGNKEFRETYAVEQQDSVLSAYVPRLWAAAYVRKLLGEGADGDVPRGRIVNLGKKYGLLTPFTSILALNSEAAYAAMGISREHSPLRGVQLASLHGVSQSRPLLATAGFLALGCDHAMPSSEQSPEPTAMTASAEKEAKQQRLQSVRDTEGKSTIAEQAPSSGRAAKVTKKSPSIAGRLASKAKLDTSLLDQAAASMGKEEDATEEGAMGSWGNIDKTSLSDDKSLNNLGTAGGFRRQKDGTGPILPRKDLSSRKHAAPSKRKVAHNAALRARLHRQNLAPTTCSDGARRPLWQRSLLWKKRLSKAQTGAELIWHYQAAKKTCELGDWRAERSFLRLLQAYTRTVSGEEHVAVGLLLHYFATRPNVQKFLAQLVLRRTVNERVIAVIEARIFNTDVDWNRVDLELSELGSIEARLSRLQEILVGTGDDSNGQIRLVYLLSQAGRSTEAVSQARRLRERGLLTPQLAKRLGDVLAVAGKSDEALRIYSEIVEFDPHNAKSRELLGDIYLGHGWFDQAYSQYKTLTSASNPSANAWLRLAAAAAGTGRIDEALRLERRVANAQGNPGPEDPRHWARLSSAARLGRLLVSEKNQDKREQITRRLKELQLFDGPGALVVVTWADLQSRFALSTEFEKQALRTGDLLSSSPVGLAAAMLSPEHMKSATLNATLASAHRSVPLTVQRCDITWDGQSFRVETSQSELAPLENVVTL